MNKIMKVLERYFAAVYIEELRILKDHHTRITKFNSQVITAKDQLKKEAVILRSDLKKTNEQLVLIQKEKDDIVALMKKASKDGKILDPQEKYWTTRRPKSNSMKYPARQGIRVNPRIFWMNDQTIPRFKGSFDQIAKAAVTFGIRNFKYVPDQGEFWKFPFETMKAKEGDCEDIAILIANSMINSGIPAWRVRLNAGDVEHPDASTKKIGHAYVTYFTEKDSRWVVLDWCYWADSDVMNLKRYWDQAKKYFGIWFSWTNRDIFKGEILDRK